MLSINKNLDTNKIEIQITCLVIVFLISLGLMRLLPAFQSPDETTHLLRAEMISNGALLLQRSPSHTGNGREGGYVDRNFNQFASSLQRVVGASSGEVSPAELMVEAEGLRWGGEKIFVNAVGSNYYFPLIYFPHVLGLKISRELDFSMRLSYDITRAVVTLFSLFIIMWAWRIYPPPVAASVLLLTPMALFQIISPTIDGLCFALALLAISSFLAEVVWKRKLTIFENFGFYLAILILATARNNLIPILLLPLYLFWARPAAWRAKALVFLVIATIFWTWFGLTSSLDIRIPRSHSTTEVIKIYLLHPVEFLLLCLKTLWVKRQFFAGSFVGILGWLDAPISKGSMIILWSFIISAFVYTVYFAKFEKADGKVRATLASIGLTSFVLVFCALAATWNDYPSEIIAGIQGRYFIISTLFMAYACGPMLKSHGSMAARLNGILTVLFAFVSVCILAVTLVARYKMLG